MSTQHILVVDDDESIRSSLEDFLSLEGFKISTAENGSEALKNLLTSQHDELPGLIILDLRMPILDGVGFLKTIDEKYSHLKKIPVVVASADLSYSSDPITTKVRCSLKKPFDLDQIIETVHRCINI